MKSTTESYFFLGELLKQGIPYNQHWAAGSEYTAGSRYPRFTQDGLAVIQEVYEENKNPDLVSLLDNINDHEVLKTLIRRHAAHTCPLPWDNQVEYGKRYQARQLIDPQEPLTSNP